MTPMYFVSMIEGRYFATIDLRQKLEIKGCTRARHVSEPYSDPR